MNQSIYSCRIQIQIVLKHLKKLYPTASIKSRIYSNKTQPSDNQLIINNILLKHYYE